MNLASGKRPEEQRVATLRDAGLLDGPSEPHLDRLISLAAAVLHAPAAMLTLAADERQVHVSSAGWPAVPRSRDASPLGQSLCELVVATGSPLVVPDTETHPELREDPAVAEFSIRAVAAYPVSVDGAQVLGDLAVIDYVPRSWNPDELARLETLSAMVSREIEQRLAVRRLDRTATHHRAQLEELLSAAPPFRTLVEQSLVGIAVLTESGFSYVNPRLAEIFGYTPEEVLALPSPAALAVEEDRPLVMRNVQRRLAGSVKDLRYSFRGLRRDGKQIVVEVQGTRTRLGTSDVIVSSVLDVTEQRRSERALRETEERYRMVVRAAVVAVWDWKVATGEVLWNGSSHELLRYRPDEMGRSIGWWYERLHPDDREPVIRSLHAALESVTSTWSAEHRFKRGDSSYASVLDCCSVLRDDSGTAVRVIGSMMDITERKRQADTQELLARASALLAESATQDVALARLARLAVPALGDCCTIQLATRDDDLELVALAHIDPAVERRMQDPAAPVLHWLTSLAGQVRRQHAPLLLTGTTWHGTSAEPAAVRPGDAGAESEFESVMLVPLLAEGRVLGVLTLATCQPGRRFGPFYLLVAEDLARRIAATVEHERLLVEAHAAIAARDEVLGVVTHDLLNPLNVVQLTAEFLSEQAQAQLGEHHQKLELIQNAVTQMQRLTRDLLEVSRFEAGVYPLNTAEYLVEALFSEAQTMLQPLADRKGIGLEFRVQKETRTVRVDAPRILRVIANLVGNAIKFTPERGRVRVDAVTAGAEVQVRVADTGPGIPPELLSHVFDRYWQAERGDGRGAGLGLAIAKGIVEAHGGRIWATSPAGDGAEFVFTVPKGS